MEKNTDHLASRDQVLKCCIVSDAGNIYTVLDLRHIFFFFFFPELFSLLNYKCHLITLYLQWKQKAIPMYMIQELQVELQLSCNYQP